MRRAILVFGMFLWAGLGSAPAGQTQDKPIQEQVLITGAWQLVGTGPTWSPADRLPPLLKRYTKAFPSMAVYRFEIGPGTELTFETEYPGDGIKGAAAFMGVDPQSWSDYSAPAPEGSAYIIQHNRDFPARYSVEEAYGQRTHVTIAKNIQHRTVWVLFLATKPATSFRVRVCKPPCYEKTFIRSSGSYVRVPGRPDRLSFSNVYDSFWLGYRAGDEPKKK